MRNDMSGGLEEWYKAAYVIHIDHVSGAGRIKVWTDKQAWLSANPASVMMHKVRAAILGKVEELGMDVVTVRMQDCSRWIAFTRVIQLA